MKNKPVPRLDTRSDSRKALDEQLAAAPLLPVPQPAAGDVVRPLEEHLLPRRPIAVEGGDLGRCRGPV
jgi:hypothetical protein